jgi:hypothetical protein
MTIANAVCLQNSSFLACNLIKECSIISSQKSSTKFFLEKKLERETILKIVIVEQYTCPSDLLKNNPSGKVSAQRRVPIAGIPKIKPPSSLPFRS